MTEVDAAARAPGEITRRGCTGRCPTTSLTPTHFSRHQHPQRDREQDGEAKAEAARSTPMGASAQPAPYLTADRAHRRLRLPQPTILDIQGGLISELDIPAGATAVESETAALGCACTLFAVVVCRKPVRNCGAVNSDNPAVGDYRMVFNQDVSNCAWAATIGLPGVGIPLTGQVSVAGAR